MSKVKLYTGTQHNQSINLWGEIAAFDAEGVTEVSEETAKKAAASIPADFSLKPTNKKAGKVSSFSHVRSGDGIGRRAASVVEKEHKEKIAADKKAEKESKASKKTSKKSSKKSTDKASENKNEEANSEDATEFPPNDENPKDSDSKGKDSKDIWK